MATLRQKKLARAIVENTKAKIPKNKQELLVSAGYSVITAEAGSSDIMEQKGVKDELKILGFDPDTAKRVVSKILSHGENENVQLKAADMVFKIHGSYAPEKQITLNINESTERTQELGNRLNGLFRRGNKSGV